MNNLEQYPNQPLFSIIVATYNRAETLPRALDSVFNQKDAPSYELIVVDDGSTDDTRQILSSYEGRCRVFSQENAGPGAARNLGIEVASGRYICFLDSDDYWLPETLDFYQRLLNNNNDPSFVVAAMVESEEQVIEGVSGGDVVCEVGESYFSFIDEFFMIGCPVMIVNREILAEIGGFHGGRINCEDSDLCLRLGLAPGFVRVNSPPSVVYLRQDDSLSISSVGLNLKGVLFMLSEEKAGRYPGGDLWRCCRSKLLSTHARSISTELVRSGKVIQGLKLYAIAISHHVRARRWKYLICYPVFAAFSMPRFFIRKLF